MNYQEIQALVRHLQVTRYKNPFNKTINVSDYVYALNILISTYTDELK